jgi:hypothetical protein
VRASCAGLFGRVVPAALDPPEEPEDADDGSGQEPDGDGGEKQEGYPAHARTRPFTTQCLPALQARSPPRPGPPGGGPGFPQAGLRLRAGKLLPSRHAAPRPSASALSAAPARTLLPKPRE